MKGCFSIIIAFVLCFVLLIVLRQKSLTPEERAAEKEAFERRQEIMAQQDKAEEMQAEEERRAKIFKRVELEELRPQFIEWLQRNAGVSTARFNEDTLEVKLDKTPLNKDVARVTAEQLAHAWRLRSGLEHAECAIYFGNEIYATGEDSGPVPEIYLARKRHEMEQELSKKPETEEEVKVKKASDSMPASEGMQAEAAAAMTGKTFAEIEGTHGAALSKEKATGWAEWPKFRARFEGGKAVEVTVK